MMFLLYYYEINSSFPMHIVGVFYEEDIATTHMLELGKENPNNNYYVEEVEILDSSEHWQRENDE